MIPNSLSAVNIVIGFSDRYFWKKSSENGTSLVSGLFKFKFLKMIHMSRPFVVPGDIIIGCASILYKNFNIADSMRHQKFFRSLYPSSWGLAIKLWDKKGTATTKHSNRVCNGRSHWEYWKDGTQKYFGEPGSSDMQDIVGLRNHAGSICRRRRRSPGSLA